MTTETHRIGARWQCPDHHHNVQPIEFGSIADGVAQVDAFLSQLRPCNRKGCKRVGGDQPSYTAIGPAAAIVLNQAFDQEDW